MPSYTGEGDMMGLPGRLLCYWITRATVALNGKIVRIELATLGWAAFASLLISLCRFGNDQGSVFQVKEPFPIQVYF